MPRFDQPIEPMTLGNMRELDVRSFHMSCWNCHHQAVLSADRPDESPCPRWKIPTPESAGPGSTPRPSSLQEDSPGNQLEAHCVPQHTGHGPASP
jgi:hypothetical protein